MKVRMLKQYNQFVDGKALPAPGGVVDINPAAFAVYLVKIGVAEVVTEDDAPAEKKAAAPAQKRAKATSKTPKETR